MIFEPAFETLDTDAMRALQGQRLRALVATVQQRVSMYRERLAATGIAPDDIRSIDDITRLPITRKDDLRDHYPFGLLAVPRQQVMRVHASSGTTGKATVVAYTANDVDLFARVNARALAMAGAAPGMMLHNAYGYGLFTGGLGIHYGGEHLGLTVVPVSGGMTERQVALLMDFGASVLCATPSYALAIAEVAEHMGVDLRQSRLRVGMFGAEPWSAAMRHDIEARLGLRAYDVYGLSEIMGPGVACECECRNGLHGWEDHFLFELVDPETGAPVADGEAGELVITTLTKEALPMLRYRTRDITRLTHQRCDCGRTHLRILRVTGRNDDMLIIRGVNVYPSQIEAVLVGRPGLSPHYQLVIERRGSLDHLRIEVEAVPGLDPAAFDAMARQAVHHVKSMIGVSAEVAVMVPGSLPRSQGKAARVRDLRQEPTACA